MPASNSNRTRIQKSPSFFTVGSSGIQFASESPIALELAYLKSPGAVAGFPSPAQDYVEETLDLNELMIRNPPATFFARVDGDSLIDLGILNADIVAVDRSLTPRNGSLVIATYDGEIVLKVYTAKRGGAIELQCRNEAKALQYRPLVVSEGHTCEIWGVVTGVVRKF